MRLAAMICALAIVMCVRCLVPFFLKDPPNPLVRPHRRRQRLRMGLSEQLSRL